MHGEMNNFGISFKPLNNIWMVKCTRNTSVCNMKLHLCKFDDVYCLEPWAPYTTITHTLIPSREVLTYPLARIEITKTNFPWKLLFSEMLHCVAWLDIHQIIWGNYGLLLQCRRETVTQHKSFDSHACYPTLKKDEACSSKI